jgi:hypothetical protein
MCLKNFGKDVQIVLLRLYLDVTLYEFRMPKI